MEKQKICRIRDLFRAITSLENMFQEAFDLNLNEAMLLCLLNEESSMTSTEIAEKLGLTASNASKVLGSVERKKLVKRSLGKTDRRQMHFKLSEQGQEKLGHIDCGRIELPEILAPLMEKQGE
ncbi:MAG: MarR family transcriptional regulator [Prevotella sp.]|nr:MarR family transcriptional regulator [Prevotella sp.]